MIPPTNIDADQVNRYGQQNLSRSAAIPLETQFQKSIMSIRLLVQSGLSETAIDAICDMLEDINDKLNALENR